MNLHGINLVGLRRSERIGLARCLVSELAMQNFARAIENTLSAFRDAVPQTQEQIYLFGADMRRLVDDRANKEVNIPALRSHADEDVQVMFAGGFMGLSFEETLRVLAERRQGRWENIASANKNEIEVRN